MNESEFKLTDGEVVAVFNTTPVPTDAVAQAMAIDPNLKQVADSLSQWVTRVSGSGYRRGRRIGSIVDRDRWLAPETPFEEMRLAREALRDDVVGTAADGSEAFALSKVGIYSDQEDEEEFWNLWAGEFNLDDQLRKAWRILYSDSQFCACTWTSTRTFPLEGETEAGNQRRKKFKDMLVPVGMSFLDTSKVTPVGSLMFGQERLAYVASPMEALRFDMILAKKMGPDALAAQRNNMPKRVRTPRGGWMTVPSNIGDTMELEDPLVEQLIKSRYQPSFDEYRELDADGVDCTNLFILNPEMTFRHTLTRPDFNRFSDVRLRQVFELLDMKAQLRQQDRVVLIGGSNWILLITKGTDLHPAQQPEIDALRAQSFTMASIPVIVGDHRLHVEIITPKQDFTLKRERYDTIDVRLFAAAWSTFVPTGADQDDALKTAKVIAKQLESRRLMLRRTIEREIFDKIRLANAPKLTRKAKLVFTPATISLAFDAAWASFLLELRASNEISRQTILGSFDLSQNDEARMRQREKDSGLDDLFQTQQPFGQKNPANPADPNAPQDPATTRPAQRAAGRRAKGGGAAPGSGQGQPPRRPGRLANPESAPKKAAATLLDARKDELVEIATDLEIVGRHKMSRGQLQRAIRDARRASRAAAVRDGLEDEEQE